MKVKRAKELVSTLRVRTRGTSKHALIMVLCCLIPLVILGVLWAIGISGGYLILGVMLLCPLLHIFMMRGIHKRGGDGSSHVH